MPTFTVKLSQMAADALEKAKQSRGAEFDSLLDEAVIAYFATEHLTGIPSPKSMEELGALVDDALEKGGQIELTPEYFEEMHRRTREQVARKK